MIGNSRVFTPILLPWGKDGEGYDWVIHVYGPGLRYNPTVEGDRQIPLMAVHDPATRYRTFFLADAVTLAGRSAIQVLPRKLSVGRGTQVDVGIITAEPFTAFWQRPEGFTPGPLDIPQPKWIDLTHPSGKAKTRDEVFQEILDRYLAPAAAEVPKLVPAEK